MNEDRRPKEYFPILITAMLRQIAIIERYGANSTMIEACETISGVMAEQSELFTKVETSNDTELKKWLERRGKRNRIYSAHFLAIRDVFRLAKLVGELIEIRNGFIEDGGEQWLNTAAGKKVCFDDDPSTAEETEGNDILTQ